MRILDGRKIKLIRANKMNFTVVTYFLLYGVGNIHLNKGVFLHLIIKVLDFFKGRGQDEVKNDISLLVKIKNEGIVISDSNLDFIKIKKVLWIFHFQLKVSL